jgi:hypothetical protein
MPACRFQLLTALAAFCADLFPYQHNQLFDLGFFKLAKKIKIFFAP